MNPTATPDSIALSIQGLAKQFGGLHILDNVSFQVKVGERRAIIGPNGAGKTTLFNMIAGDLEPTNGQIYFFGEEITHLPNFQRVRKGIVRTFQKNNLISELSVLDNLLLVLQRRQGLVNVWYRPRTPKYFGPLFDEAEHLLESWNLIKRKDTLVKHLSYGEQRQVEILLGIATEPKLLLLDEPTAGMSQAETSYITQMLKKLPPSLTLLIIEHDMEVVFDLADHIMVLHNGGILAEGPPEAIRQNREVHEVYFGREGEEIAASG
mgnify:CR=1 FL=1